MDSLNGGSKPNGGCLDFQSFVLRASSLHLLSLLTVPYTTMSSPHVLRFDRSDEQGSFILVHLVHASESSLDLTLTATEGEGAYAASSTPQGH